MSRTLQWILESWVCYLVGLVVGAVFMWRNHACRHDVERRARAQCADVPQGAGRTPRFEGYPRYHMDNWSGRMPMIGYGIGYAPICTARSGPVSCSSAASSGCSSRWASWPSWPTSSIRWASALARHPRVAPMPDVNSAAAPGRPSLRQSRLVISSPRRRCHTAGAVLFPVSSVPQGQQRAACLLRSRAVDSAPRCQFGHICYNFAP